MKKALMVLLVCTFPAVVAFAAEPVTKAGTKAVLFGAQYAGLQPYEGSYGVGFKYYLAEGLALRPVLLFNYLTETETTPSDTTPAGYNVTYEDDKDKYFDFGLELGLERSLLTQGPVSVFAGGVAGFAMKTHQNTYGYTRTYDDGDIYNYSREVEYGGTTALKVAGLLGFEYFFSKSISISGEYRLGYAMNKSDLGKMTETDSYISGGVTTTVITVTEVSGYGQSNFGFSTAGLKLGIYF